MKERKLKKQRNITSFYYKGKGEMRMAFDNPSFILITLHIKNLLTWQNFIYCICYCDLPQIMVCEKFTDALNCFNNS